MVIEHPYLSVTLERVDPQWYPVIYYMGKAMSRKGREFSRGMIDRSQLEDFIKGAEDYFKGLDDGN